jgi:hypothetical protein
MQTEMTSAYIEHMLGALMHAETLYAEDIMKRNPKAKRRSPR